MRTCQRCGDTPARPHERYCTECRRAVLAELKAAGYLTPTPRRKRSHPENRDAAAQLEPSPSGENAVRAMEDA
jgi:hypothetical protein